MSDPQACENTDRELYREPTDKIGYEFYMPSLFVTKDGAIGIDVGGTVHVRPLRFWHAAPDLYEALERAVAVLDSDELKSFFATAFAKGLIYTGPSVDMDAARAALSRANPQGEET